MDYNLVVTNDDNEWNALVASSPQGNIFSDTRYLNALNNKYTCYLVKAKHGETLAGVVIIENGSAMHDAPFPYTPYNGILFGESVSKLQNHKRVTSEFRITEFLIRLLYNKYGNFSMALSPAFNDLRPFIWHNYNEKSSSRFTIKYCYTSILELKNFQLESYLKNIRAVRRQEYKKADVNIKNTSDSALFLELYVETFKRQGHEITTQQIELLDRIIKGALENNFGVMKIATTIQGVASMSLFVYDTRNAFYLLGANNPKLRNTGASTALMIDNICSMAELNLSALDFVGVNSPNRGDFKLSFNSILVPYHQVQLN